MFDSEEVKDGITIKAYRFESLGKEKKPVMSLLVRMQGPHCQIGNEVIGPVIEAEKKETLAKMEALPKPSWFKGRFQKPTKEEKQEQDMLGAKFANPLFDLPRERGEELLMTFANAFIARGLKEVERVQKSNGELWEEVVRFA